ncbi:MAG: hypothetical protein HDS77_06840 [Bacteroidales bacterium]|nr:hypothetical protein [Bacteroidales bacterium]
MEIRTYSVEGFIDWQCEIPVGRAKATLHFSGGAMTAYGVTPATYSTGDPVKQKIIENSTFYKNGRIKLLRKTGEPDPVKPRVPKAKKMPAVENTAPALSPEPKAEPYTPVFKSPELTVTDHVAEASSQSGDDISETEAETIESTADKEAASYVEQVVEEVEAATLNEVAVSCLPEAQNYLRDHFGIPTSKSRSKEKAQAFARENGIVFIGLN